MKAQRRLVCESQDPFEDTGVISSAKTHTVNQNQEILTFFPIAYLIMFETRWHFRARRII